MDIFGISADINEIKKIIKGKNIKVISDSAQSPYFYYGNKLAGTLADIGGFSLNCHKHINTGEGGIVVTNDKKLADRVYKIRNHAEASVDLKDKINNMIGYNFRMGELEAAIGLEQFKKLKNIILKEINYLTNSRSSYQNLEALKFQQQNLNKTIITYFLLY